MNRSPSSLVTELLVRWKAGDKQALQRVILVVYRELREIARYHLAHERPEHTLQSAALVHEAYVRIAEQRTFDTENRADFLAVASRLTGQILVDHFVPPNAVQTALSNWTARLSCLRPEART